MYSTLQKRYEELTEAQQEAVQKLSTIATRRYNDVWSYDKTSDMYKAAIEGKSTEAANNIIDNALALCGDPFYTLNNEEHDEATGAFLARFKALDCDNYPPQKPVYMGIGYTFDLAYVLHAYYSEDSSLGLTLQYRDRWACSFPAGDATWEALKHVVLESWEEAIDMTLGFCLRFVEVEAEWLQECITEGICCIVPPLPLPLP
jgi:hypothetical protein